MSLNKSFALSSAALLLLLPMFVQADSPNPVFNPRVPVKGEAAVYLHGIEIRNADGTLSDAETTIAFPSSSVIRLDLGLGDSTAKSITLQPKTEGRQFRVEQRYETSLTLMNEGPHMDLVDWKHYISQWQVAEKRSGLTFLSKEVSSDRFPKVTQTEIIEAARAQSKKWASRGYDAGERWVGLARQCKGPNEYPCGVSVSKVILRIMVREAGAWKEIQNIELIIPMGC